MAGGKVRTVGGEDDDFDVVVTRRHVEGVVQLVEQLGVLRVACLRAVQHDAGNMLGWGFIEDGLELLHKASFVRVVQCSRLAASGECLFDHNLTNYTTRQAPATTLTEGGAIVGR